MARSEWDYGAGARSFHWITTLLVLPIIPIGIIMIRLPRGALQDTLFVAHESLGLAILGLTVLRLAWRLAQGAPRPSPELGPLEARASRAAHALLYVLLLAMPATGYLLVVYGGFPLTFFGLAEVPRLVAKDKPLSELAGAAHLTLQWVIYAAVLAHVAAALHHHFLRHNAVLARMWPGLPRQTP